MFNHKAKLRQGLEDQLVDVLSRCKNQWISQKRIIENSIEPSDEVLHQLHLTEAKYLFLLKEVRHKKVQFTYRQ